jgi:hypothetical protein
MRFLALESPSSGTVGQVACCLGLDLPSPERELSNAARFAERLLSLSQATLEHGVRRHGNSKDDVVADAWAKTDAAVEMIGSDPPLLG